MKRLSEVTGLPLQWMQPSAWREAYELRAGDDLVATLGWYLAVMMHQDSSAAAVVVAA
jgi:hypothetical protein